MTRKRKETLRPFVATVTVTGRALVYFDARDQAHAEEMARAMDFGDSAHDDLREWEYDDFVKVEDNS